MVLQSCSSGGLMKSWDLGPTKNNNQFINIIEVIRNSKTFLMRTYRLNVVLWRKVSNKSNISMCVNEVNRYHFRKLFPILRNVFSKVGNCPGKSCILEHTFCLRRTITIKYVSKKYFTKKSNLMCNYQIRLHWPGIEFSTIIILLFPASV